VDVHQSGFYSANGSGTAQRELDRLAAELNRR
jgi:hypothetical protein